MKTIEVATAELKNGIYEVHYGYEENGIAVEDLVTHISEAMLNWFIVNPYNYSLGFAYEDFTTEQLCEKYLTWYNQCSQVSVTLDKPYEFIYTAKRGDILAWLLVDEELNIIEPHKLPNEQQHKLKYEAHFKEATKNQALNF